MIKTSLVSSYCHVNPNPILLGQKFNLHAHAIFTKQSWVRVLQSGFLSYKWRNHQRLGDMHGKLKHRTSIITTGAEIQLIFPHFPPPQAYPRGFGWNVSKLTGWTRKSSKSL